MKHLFTRRTAAGVVAAGAVAGLVVMVPGAAFAAAASSNTAASSTTAGSSNASTKPSSPLCTPAIFAQAQQRVEGDLAGRVTQLNALLSAVNNTATHLTAGDRQTLQNSINNVELPGIQTLQTQVPQDTTCQELRTAAHSMVFDYRVYVVMTPQTHLTIVLDDETYVEGVFTTLEPKIATAIQNAQAAGKNVAAAQAAFNDLKSQVSTAQGATNGQATLVLAQTPKGYPGNWPVFTTARTDATTAHSDLHTAYTDAEQIRTDLQ
jgi:hypothetical protein